MAATLAAFLRTTVMTNQMDLSLGSDHGGEAVIVCTPYSTGKCIAYEIQKRGYQVICLWNKDFCDEMKLHVPSTCVELSYYAELTELDTIQDTAAVVQKAAGPCKIVACICGGEAGVNVTDSLSEELGLLSNGTHVPQRQDKKHQQELVQAAGLRSIRQAGGNRLEHVESFLRNEAYPVVVKPVDSAGSDGVKLCHTYEEATQHVISLLYDHKMVNGGQCHSVLCQEFLQGTEYVIDHVSRHGVHKTVMLWKYDKRPANGGPFVYHGVIPIDSESPVAQLLIPYIRGVLDAIGFQNGASHGEAILTSDGGPCLVEMNCRVHGADGNWMPLCQELVGYTQVDAAVDSYLDEVRFEALPDQYPSPFQSFGQEVDLVSFSEGVVHSTPGFDVIKTLPSFVFLESLVRPGGQVRKTVDLVTAVGAVILIHHDKAVVERDIGTIRRMEREDALFHYRNKDDDDDCTEERSLPLLEQLPCHTTAQEEQINKSRQILLDSMLEINHPRKISMGDATDLYW